MSIHKRKWKIFKKKIKRKKKERKIIDGQVLETLARNGFQKVNNLASVFRLQKNPETEIWMQKKLKPRGKKNPKRQIFGGFFCKKFKLLKRKRERRGRREKQ